MEPRTAAHVLTQISAIQAALDKVALVDDLRYWRAGVVVLGRGPSSGPPAVRAIAIVRVVAWHAFGAAAITYFVAAMPAMFFVTGSLLDI